MFRPAPSLCGMDLGLDFGTTHTVVAHADRGNYPVVSFLDGDGDAHDHFPSVAALDGEGLVFGFEALEAARRGAVAARSFKRLLADPGAAPGARVRVGVRELPVLDVVQSGPPKPVGMSLPMA